MQSISTRHYRYSSRQYCRGSNFDVTDAAKLAVVRGERDKESAPISSLYSNSTPIEFALLNFALLSNFTQLVIQTTAAACVIGGSSRLL